jgi:pyruvate,orthophosphate dikinase
MGETSATGVGFTRNPATGEKKFYGEFLENAQGEDVVAGIRTPHPISELESWNPAVYNQLRDITTMLEKHYRDIQDFEFTIQDGKLFMLQTRNGKRTGPAAVRIAVEMVGEGLIDKREAILRVDPQQLDQLLHPVLDPKSKKELTLLAEGLPASPGASVGTIVFNANDAVEKSAKAPVILVRKETVPDDIHGMEVAKGILTSRGGMTSHAAVVCRGMGTPCVAGAEEIAVSEAKKEVSVTVGGKTVTLKEGDWLSLDGSTGEVFAGKANTLDADPSSGVLKDFMGRRLPRRLWRARQRRYPARRAGRPPIRRRRHRALPYRAHVLRRRPHRAHAGHDSGARRKVSPQGPAKASADAARRFRRTLQSHGRIPGGDPHARSAAARVPAEARRPDGGHRRPALRRH